MNFISQESQCFPKNEVKANLEIRGKQNSLFPKEPRHKVICHIAQQNKDKYENRAEIPATTPGHLQLHALITCNSGQYCAVSRLTPCFSQCCPLMAFGS